MQLSLETPAPALLTARRPMRIGVGSSIAHHGELFQGQMEDSAGVRHRCLVSLPCYHLLSQATFLPDNTGQVRVEPRHKRKARRVVELALRHLGRPHLGGLLTLDNNIPEGKGYGSSTSDCVAAANSVADSLGRNFADHEIATLVVTAETASDNIMFRRAVLFAQREGIVLEDYRRPFPDMEVLGIDVDPAGFVDTLVYPPAQYDWSHLQTFHTLIGALRRAMRTSDIHLLGCVATASSALNDQFLPKPLFAEIRGLASHTGVLGISAAHSGTVLSLLLDPRHPALERSVDAIRKELDSWGIGDIMRFRTSLAVRETAA